MKIGILTFHYAHNYGAILQSYALREYLRSKGHSVRLLDYRNKAIASEYIGDLPYRYKAKDLLHFRLLPKWLSSRKDVNVAQPYWRRRCESFNSFIDRFILEGEMNRLDAKGVQESDCDAFVVGSDQVWNQYLERGIDPVYFLDFETKAKKIFYAASNGYDHIPKESMEYYKRVLDPSTYVGTREKSLAEQINLHCHTKACFVIDPSLLLDADSYDTLSSSTAIEKRYVMAYFIYEDKQTQIIAEFIARTLGLELIEFHNFYRRALKDHVQFTDKSPSEFLTYIKNAEFVVTNSFHGTAFSIIYQKKFYSVFDKDARKGDLLASLGLESRHIFNACDVDLNEEIDYQAVRSKLESLRQDSESFLLNALSENHYDGD